MYEKIFSQFNRKNILVVGDLILDQYIRGDVHRISPEAPVPVVVERESFYTPGGAANVAHNISKLGAQVSLIGRVGDDLEGEILRRELKKNHIGMNGVIVDKTLPTIRKTRVIAGHQQIVRIDREQVTTKGSNAVRRTINAYIDKHIKDFDGVIISDYGKGLITPELVGHLCELTLTNKKVITVDPKMEHFDYYRNVTAITPNLKEAENAIRNIKITSKSTSPLAIHSDKLDTEQDIDLAGKELLRYLGLDALLITLGEHGMKLFESGKKAVSIKTKAQEVYDVSGAGDAVISAFTLSLSAGATKRQAAEIANVAGGIVVGKMGAVGVTKEELLKAIKGQP